MLREGSSVPAPELRQRLLDAVAAWRPRDVPQQDDITLIVIDAL